MAKRITSIRDPHHALWQFLDRIRPSDERVRDPLIHVGIRKAASTYLQYCFSEVPTVRMAALERLENAVFEHVLSDEAIDPFLAQVKERFPPRWKRPHVWRGKYVVSNERFAITPRMIKYVQEGPDASRYYDRFWALTVGSLQRLFPEGRVLVVTRAARPWVKSVYSQAIRGAIANHRFPAFIRASREYLRQNLNDARMNQLFSEAFGPDRVLFLPQELLRDDPVRFFSLLSDFAGFSIQPQQNQRSGQARRRLLSAFAGVALDPSPQEEDLPVESRDASPDARELDLLLNSWRMMRLLDKYGRRDDSLFYQRFIRRSLGNIEGVFKAYYRNCVEFRSEHGQRMWEKMVSQLTVPSVPIGDFRLPADLVQESASNARFLLERPGYENYLAEYAPTVG